MYIFVYYKREGGEEVEEKVYCMVSLLPQSQNFLKSDRVSNFFLQNFFQNLANIPYVCYYKNINIKNP